MAYQKKPIRGEMPVERYPEDDEWINRQLGYLNEEDRSKVCRAYSKVFVDTKSLEPIEHKKTNAGRYAANTRLRIFIEKRLAVFNK